MKRYRSPNRIDAILEQLLRQKKWRAGLQSARIRLLWADTVGPEIAAHAHPQQLLRGRLLVECDHDVWRAELTFLRPELIRHINEAMGEELVKEIWLK